jgi:hypothetical protein
MPIEWHCLENDPLSIFAPGYSNYNISVRAKIDPRNAWQTKGFGRHEEPPYVSVCGRMASLFGWSGWCPAPTGYCLRLFESKPRPAVFSGPAVTAEPCNGSAVQQWAWTNKGYIKPAHIKGACLTASYDMEPSAGGNTAVFSAVYLGSCDADLRGGTQRWEVGPVTTAHGGWIEALVDGQESGRCVELNAGSKTFGSLDTCECTTGPSNLVWYAPGDGTMRLKNITRDIPCYCSFCGTDNTCSYCCSQTGAGASICKPGSINTCPNEQPTCENFKYGYYYGKCGPAAPPRDLCLTASHVPPAPPPAPPGPSAFADLIAYPSSALPGTALKTLSSQRLPDGFDAKAWHTLALSFEGNRISVALDGEAWAVSLEDDTFDAGLAGIGSGWNTAYYDGLSVVPTAALPPVGVVLSCISTGIALTTLNASQGDRWAGVALAVTQSVQLIGLARFQAVGNRHAHNISVFELSTGAVVASGLVDMGKGVADSTGMVWSRLSRATVLAPGKYVVAAGEHVGGDMFYGRRPPAPLCGVTNVRQGAPWCVSLSLSLSRPSPPLSLSTELILDGSVLAICGAGYSRSECTTRSSCSAPHRDRPPAGRSGSRGVPRQAGDR